MKFARLAVAEAAAVLLLTACGGSSTEEPAVDGGAISLGEAEQLNQAERVRRGTGDTTAPAITLGSQSTVGLSGTVALAGTISDNGLIYRVRWANDRGGSGRAVLAGSTSQATWTVGSIQLQAGSNVITLTAEDVAGNTSAMRVTINRDGTAAPAPSPAPSPAPAASTSWQRVASEGGAFRLDKAASVRYGVDGLYTTRNLAAEQWSCGNATFGDPAVGRFKSCEVAMSASGPVVSPAPAPAALPVAPAPAPALPPSPTPPPAPVVAAPVPTQAAGTTTFVNTALVPGPITAGTTDRLISVTGEVAQRDAGGIGASRTLCTPSHFSFDDPLVYPGQPGRAHLHVFFGNTGLTGNSTPDSVRNSGASTCRGGIVNRSAYWAPAMIDTRDGRPLVPEIAPIYYKTGYFGVRDADIRVIPAGFRMIAGDAKSQVPQSRVVSFSCGGSGSAAMPSCGAGSTMRMSVTFPQCWDGVNLSSPDHRSHVAYPTEGRGCVDPRYPVAIPEISMQIDYVMPSGGSASLRLSSDVNGAPAGSSAHADWMNGWEQDIMNLWTTRIINLGLSASGAVGDGRSLR